VISATATGLLISDAGSTGNLVQGNYIGTDVTGTAALGNTSQGMSIVNDATNNTIGGTAAGAGNTIASNGSDGVRVNTSASPVNSSNAILGNSIYSNAGLAINLQGGTENGFSVTANDGGDADTGPNYLQNFPVLTGAANHGAQGHDHRVTQQHREPELPHRVLRECRARAWRGSEAATARGSANLGFVNVTTNASGNVTFATTLTAAVAVSEIVSATATDLTTNATSEFAANVTAVAGRSISARSTTTQRERQRRRRRRCGVRQCDRQALPRQRLDCRSHRRRRHAGDDHDHQRLRRVHFNALRTAPIGNRRLDDVRGARIQRRLR